jgi:glutathione S-transferase
MYLLFYSPGTFSLAPHILLEEIGVPYELDLRRANAEGIGTGAADYLAMNPKGRVPALLGVPGRCGGVDGLLTETTAILMYLARAYPLAKLLPDDPAAEARCLEWLNWLSDTVHAVSYAQLWRPGRFAADPALWPAVVERGHQNIRDNYDLINSILADGRQWGVPTGYSIVDPLLLVFWRWGSRIGLEMPMLTALASRTLERPAVRRALQQEGLEGDDAIVSINKWRP